MIGPSFDEFIFEGEFGEVPEFVVFVFFGVEADDIERFLLSFVDGESFESLFSLGYRQLISKGRGEICSQV